MELRNLPKGVLIVAVTRGEEWFVPRGASILQEGDRVLFMGRTDAMHALAGWFTEHLGEEKTGEIVIVGGGTVGLRLARSMERNPRARIKLIERSFERCDEIAGILERTLVLNGDGADLDLLESERVRYARALVAVTDSDEKNLLVSLLGRQLGIPKVVTRVTSASNRRVFERVGIDVPLSARGAANEAVVHMIRHEEVDLLATIGEGQGELLELTLPGTFEPHPLSELRMPPDSLVAAVVRGGRSIVPGGSTLIGPGDRCLVICRTERVEEVRNSLLR
jgi:trk system potassium uptake protein TrkA